MKRTYFEHPFDEKSMVYGSETGEWMGQCQKCGIEITVYAGAESAKPTVGRAIEYNHWSQYNSSGVMRRYPVCKGYPVKRVK